MSVCAVRTTDADVEGRDWTSRPNEMFGNTTASPMTAMLAMTSTIHVSTSLVPHRVIERSPESVPEYSYWEGVTEVLSIDSCAVNFTIRVDWVAR